MMDCQNQFAPGTEELAMLAFGEEGLAPEVVQHLRACMICQRRLRQFQKLYRHLLARLYRSQCPDGLCLSFYCAGLLEREEQRRIAAHVRECPLCAEEVALTKRFMADPLLPTNSAPPLHLAAAQARRKVRLALHNGHMPATWPRQYQHEEFELALHLSRSEPGYYMLDGLLSGGHSAREALILGGVQAELLPLGRSTGGCAAAGVALLRLTSEVDRQGKLTFPAVASGRYTLLVHLPGRDLVVEELQIDMGSARWPEKVEEGEVDRRGPETKAPDPD
ncbi:hypothetical protein [Thermogemmatispora sp.]|uniref:hypothetical protein n=1 Tax=Thermogemmatispora sp. TaxID=1968838 RepID=UPI0035E4595C